MGRRDNGIQLLLLEILSFQARFYRYREDIRYRQRLMCETSIKVIYSSNEPKSSLSTLLLI